VKFLRNLSIDTQKVLMFVEYMMSVRTILEDVLDCAARGLPPPPDSKIYPMEADYCNDSMANYEDWNRKSSIFKMWLVRHAASGKVLPFGNENVAQIPALADMLHRLPEWEPQPCSFQSGDGSWPFFAEATAVCSFLAGCGSYYYYAERILPLDGSLHGYVDVLNRWLQWGYLRPHVWNECMMSMASALLSCLETASQYFTSSPVLSLPIYFMLPILERSVEVLAQRTLRHFSEYKCPRGVSPLEHINKFQNFLGPCAVRDIHMIVRGLARFSDLDVRPLETISRHYDDEVRKLFAANPPTFEFARQKVSFPLTAIITAIDIQNDLSLD
jgi:hypothetical protein